MGSQLQKTLKKSQLAQANQRIGSNNHQSLNKELDQQLIRKIELDSNHTLQSFWIPRQAEYNDPIKINPTWATITSWGENTHKTCFKSETF